MCKQQLPVLYWLPALTVFVISLLLKNYWLVEVIYLLIRFIKTKAFLWNKNNNDRNGINEQNTCTKHREK